MSSKRLFVLLTPLIISLSVSVILLWPGIFDNDSLNQWEQISTGTFSNNHPIIHTLLMYPFARAHWPAGFSILQSSAFLLTTIYVARVFRSHLNAIGITAIVITIALNPAIGISLATFWKDTLFAILLIVTGTILVDVYKKPDRVLHTYRFFFIAASIFFVASIRHNGIFAALVISAIIMFLHSNTAKYACIFALILCLLTPHILRASSVSPKHIPFINYSMLHILSGYAIANPKDVKLAEFIKPFLNEIEISEFNPEGSNWLVLNPSANHLLIRSQFSNLFWRFIYVFTHDPYAVSNLITEGARLGLYLNRNPKIGVYYYQLPSLHPAYPLAFSQSPQLEQYSSMLERNVSHNPSRLFWPPIALLAIILGSLLFTRKKRELLLFSTPSLVTYFTVLWVLPGQDYRYFLYLLYLAPFLLGLLISEGTSAINIALIHALKPLEERER